LENIDILLLNNEELVRLFPERSMELSLASASQKVKILAVKMGAAGALCIKEGLRYEAPPINVKVVDAVGAGDSFDGGFIYGFLNGEDIPRCLEYGNLCGAYNVRASGGVAGQADTQALGEWRRNGRI
jgi:sugar/nucleoside kinase (ribokinase family)